MTIRRRSARRARRLQVTFWLRGDPRGYPGFTTNISTTGMFIGTNTPCPPGTRLRIEVIDRDHGFVVEGVVAHARRRGGYDLGQHTPPGMGVRLLAVEELVRELVPGVEGEEIYAGTRAGRTESGGPAARRVRPLVGTSAGPVPGTSPEPVMRISPEPVAGSAPESTAGAPPGPSERSSPGPPAGAPMATPSSQAPAAASSWPPAAAGAQDPGAAPAGPGGERVFSVRFPSAAQFLQVFHRDIASGGLFVSTPDPARFQDVVTIELHPPGASAEPVRFRARVVHRAEARPGAGLTGPNLLAGMGVELLDTQTLCARLLPIVERLAGAES